MGPAKCWFIELCIVLITRSTKDTFLGFSVLDFLVNEESLPRRSAGCPLKIRRQLNQGGVDPANEGQLQGWQAN